MRHCLLICFWVLLTGTSSSAQNLEAGFFLGASNYQGDLQPTHFLFGESKVAFGGFVKYPVLDYLSLRASITKGTISGNDRNSTISSGRQNRNLNFRSDILDFGLQAEFHPLTLIYDDKKIISPYLMGGINGFTFNPEAFYIDRFYALAPLGTEGQFLEGSGVSPYKRLQIAIPAGVGIELKISDYNSIALEFGIRKTFTDYLDDVSGNYPDLAQLAELDPLAATLSYRRLDNNGDPVEVPVSGGKRGNSNAGDLYYFFGVNFGFNITNILNLGGGADDYSIF